MAQSFYFYDLETSGINSRLARIMQFGGQRTDMNLVPLGPPDEYFIKMTEDILPEPDAILVTGITPQKTLTDGITEAEFLKIFTSNIALPDTIFVGYNTIRFDNEFMRHLHYRNFYDAYEWQWQDKRSCWDILDVVRMTRALRPDGIKWPFGSDGRPSNRLGLLTAVNKLEHTDAHNALSDIQATIALARLIRNKQPKLFEYLLSLRDKHKAEAVVTSGEPFVYTSGRYPSNYEKTTVAVTLCPHPSKKCSLVYDLRRDPEEIKSMSAADMAKAWSEKVEDETKRFPVKSLQYNRCPAVAPLSVLDPPSLERLKLDMDAIKRHHQALSKQPDLRKRLVEALENIDNIRQATLITDENAVDDKLYDGFFSREDSLAMSVVRAADSASLSTLDLNFKDDRLTKLLPLYKARNFLSILSNDEQIFWQRFKHNKLLAGGNSSLASKYFNRLAEIVQRKDLTQKQRFILEELQIYGESILPEPPSED